MLAIVVIAALAVAAAALALGCGGDDTTSDASSPAGKVVIGAALGLVGDAAPGDVPASEAMKYEVDQINKAGGIDGKQIELIIKDMKSDPALGGTVTQELLDAGAQRHRSARRSPAWPPESSRPPPRRACPC